MPVDTSPSGPFKRTVAVGKPIVPHTTCSHATPHADSNILHVTPFNTGAEDDAATVLIEGGGKHQMQFLIEVCTGDDLLNAVQSPGDSVHTRHIGCRRSMQHSQTSPTLWHHTFAEEDCSAQTTSLAA